MGNTERTKLETRARHYLMKMCVLWSDGLMMPIAQVIVKASKCSFGAALYTLPGDVLMTMLLAIVLTSTNRFDRTFLTFQIPFLC